MCRSVVVIPSAQGSASFRLSAVGFSSQIRPESHMKNQALYTMHKLRQRGYPLDDLRQIFDRFAWSQKSDILAHKPKNARRVIPFKVHWFPNASEIRFGAILRSSADKWLPQEFLDTYTLTVCYRSHKNLFRRRYSRFT